MVSTPRRLTLPPEVSRVQVPTARGEFAALVAGPEVSDDPTVLLVPGWTGSKEDFLTLLPLLAESGRRAVAVDPRGQYQTPGSDDPAAYTLAALASDVLAVAAAVSDQPVDLVGHSFGGLVAGQATVEAPDRISSLVLLASGPGALPADQHDDLRRIVASLAQRGPEDTWRDLRAHERAGGAPMPPAHIEEWLRQRFTTSHPTALAAVTTLLMQAPDLSHVLHERPTPALVLTGELDDAWPVATQQEMARRMGATFVQLSGLGHSPAVEDPARTATALIEFWNTWSPGLSTTFDLVAESSEVTRARHGVRATLRGKLPDARVDDAELLTSELVTNAVLHARAPVHLRLDVRGGHVVVAVSDAGIGDIVADRENFGRGLLLVRSLTPRCGAWTGPTGSTVWFWLPVVPEPAVPEPGAQAPALGSPVLRKDSPDGSNASHDDTASPISCPSGQESR